MVKKKIALPNQLFPWIIKVIHTHSRKSERCEKHKPEITVTCHLSSCPASLVPSLGTNLLTFQLVTFDKGNLSIEPETGYDPPAPKHPHPTAVCRNSLPQPSRVPPCRLETDRKWKSRAGTCFNSGFCLISRLRNSLTLPSQHFSCPPSILACG